MARFEFRVAGVTEDELEPRDRENRNSSRWFGGSKAAAGGFKFSLGVLVLGIAVVAVIYTQQQKRRYVSLDSFGKHDASGEQSLGGTKAVPHALKGDIYALPPNTERLPDFSKLQPIGTIYATDLNVPQRAFTDGFPGVTDRYEWFALRYTGKFLVDKEGDYRFSLTSDDGSKLLIDAQLIIDNDGMHGPLMVEKVIRLQRGTHDIEVQYFQGPRTAIALVLDIARL